MTPHSFLLMRQPLFRPLRYLRLCHRPRLRVSLRTHSRQLPATVMMIYRPRPNAGIIIPEPSICPESYISTQRQFASVRSLCDIVEEGEGRELSPFIHLSTVDPVGQGGL